MAFAAIVAVVAAACSSDWWRVGRRVESVSRLVERQRADRQGLAADRHHRPRSRRSRAWSRRPSRRSYTIEFKSDGTFSAKADCNQVAGAYTTTASGGMTITPGPSTMAMCPPESTGPPVRRRAVDGRELRRSTIGELTITSSDQGTLQYK